MGSCHRTTTRGTNTLPGRLLPLTQEEKAEMHKFIQEHLKGGTIHISKSPYAANFFFMKKKDGKLWPIKDYHPINKWTKKNRNVSPLIPQVIDQLSRCTKFTIVDICWGYNNCHWHIQWCIRLMIVDSLEQQWLSQWGPLPLPGEGHWAVTCW